MCKDFLENGIVLVTNSYCHLTHRTLSRLAAVSKGAPLALEVREFVVKIGRSLEMKVDLSAAVHCRLMSFYCPCNSCLSEDYET